MNSLPFKWYFAAQFGQDLQPLGGAMPPNITEYAA